MRKTSCLLLLTTCLLSCLLFLCSCNSQQPLISDGVQNAHAQTSDTTVTSRGTPITSSFDRSSITMIETPESSCFSEIGYIEGEQLLCVTFRESGDSYIYFGIPDYVWNELCNADSMGSYYNSSIKGSYLCDKLS